MGCVVRKGETVCHLFFKGVFVSMGEEGGGGGRRCFFVLVSRVLRVGEWMGERVSDFFHSSQKEEICEDLCR